jgi:FkbM family methyltransferase
MFEPLKRIVRRRCPFLLSAYHGYRASRELAGREPRLTPHGFHFIGHEAMEAGTFEPFETRFIAEQARRCRVLVDVGANAGYFVCLARRAGQHVMAIEPMPMNVDLLLRNITANEWKDIEVFPVGLSAQPGYARLYGGGTGASLVERWSGTSGAWHHTVPLSTLDVLLAGRFPGESMVIKIDVEGAEYDVLRGASQTLQRVPPPVWLVEVNLTEHHPSGLNPHFIDVFDVFWSAGYVARTADEEGRHVERTAVEQWIANRHRDFGTINYIFEKSS